MLCLKQISLQDCWYFGDAKLGQNNIPDEVLDSFSVPRLFKFLVWAIAIFILFIGIVSSFYWDTWMCFARAGAVIVILALALEASGYIDRYVSKLLEVVREVSPSLVVSQVLNNKYLYGLKGNETDEQLADIVVKENARRLNYVAGIMEGRLYKELRKTEFKIAALGTFLWGFADLVELIIPVSQ
jgi:hypothetical protein